jgi:hypothetical protein
MTTHGDEFQDKLKESIKAYQEQLEHKAKLHALVQVSYPCMQQALEIPDCIRVYLGIDYQEYPLNQDRAINKKRTALSLLLVRVRVDHVGDIMSMSSMLGHEPMFVLYLINKKSKTKMILDTTNMQETIISLLGTRNDTIAARLVCK